MKKIMLLAAVCSTLLGSVWADEVANQAPVTEAVSADQATSKTNTMNNVAIDKNGDVNLVASDDESVSISDNMKIISKVQHLEDPKFSYEIDTSYPQIQGENLSDGAKQFNSLVEKAVSDEVKRFKTSVSLDQKYMQTLPEEMRKNSLKVDYDIDLVKPKNQTLVSVRISFEGMQAGRPHPYHNNKVVNFDLTTGKVIALNELFKSRAQFLKVLATFTRDALDKKLKKDNWMVAQGTKPDVKNFKNWNLQADSLLITFDEYQVAPYSFGAQEVEIPYSALKKILSAKAPIADCVKSAENCQVG